MTMTTTTAAQFLIFYLALGATTLQCNLVDSFSPSQQRIFSSTTRTTTTPLLFATRSVGGGGSTLPKRANKLIETLWGSSKEEAININRITSVCSNDVVWEDMPLKKPVQGKNAVRELLQAELPRGTTITTLNKVSDGATSAGFTWTRECDGQLGLRGTTYVWLDDEGKIDCIKELAEPLYKPGDMMIKLLQAETKKNAPRPEKNPTSYVEENPTSCSKIVDYTWKRGAYLKDAPVDEAVKLYSPDWPTSKPFVEIGMTFLELNFEFKICPREMLLAALLGASKWMARKAHRELAFMKQTAKGKLPTFETLPRHPSNQY
jgi:hypothetical protein